VIILDTNVLSETQRPNPDPKVLAWLDAQAPSNLYLTAITVGELMFGVHCLDPGARRAGLLATLTAIFETDFRGRILPYDAAAACVYGERIGAARRGGITIGQADGQIAAIAFAQDAAAIATRDRKPFDTLHLPVINPWE
jgi:predicted nucleic acid-binding protein